MNYFQTNSLQILYKKGKDKCCISWQNWENGSLHQRKPAKKIGELCGKKVDTVSDIEEALTDYSESNNDMYLQFIEYTVIDD